MPEAPSIDWALAIQLVTVCIQSQNAFHDDGDYDPATGYPPRTDPNDPTKPSPPPSPQGFTRIDCFTGVDTWGPIHETECFGLVYRSTTEADSYIFSFRGSKSVIDWIGDAEFTTHIPFKPFSVDAQPEVPKDATVSLGFWGIYAGAQPSKNTQSMQQQLFNLLRKYQPKKIYITGHSLSLGGALCELFTLDLVLSNCANIEYGNYNFGCPMVGNNSFADFCNAEKTPTLRIQNIDDIVPCCPPAEFGYAQVGRPCLIGFHGTRAFPHHLLDNHMAQNYKPVLECAATSTSGVCICNNLKVPWPTMTVVSFQPDPNDFCKLLNSVKELGAAAMADFITPGT